jgi:HAD superfamily hydrolase (TIGR01509 family)
MLRILDDADVRYEDDIIKTITPLGYLGTANYYREHYGLKDDADSIVRAMKKYAFDEYAYTIPEKEGVKKTLKRLKDGGADLHILTASPHEVLDVCLARLGMAELFTNIWSCDDFGTGKSDPDIYVRAAEKIGRPIGEVLFLDDNLNAVKTARSAGMSVCGVYDPSSDGYVGQMKAATDYYIFNMQEVLEI